MAGGPPDTNTSTPPNTVVWDQSALLQALVAISNPPAAAAGTSDWFLDTGATSHIASHPGMLHSLVPSSYNSLITVGNGAQLPVTRTAAASIPMV